MSGLVGLFYRDGRPVAPDTLVRLNARLAHRGLDGSGQWHSGPVGLAQQHTATTPESVGERQPLTSADSALTITADARLDNRAELCAALALPDTGQPDAALILAAYARWGAGCAEHLLGDFAFAIWDAARQTLYCARDPIGFRPFFYTLTPRLFACASEIKALLVLPEAPRQLNELRLADYLWPNFNDPAATFYSAIQRLPPGHCLTVTPEGHTLRAYWRLEPGTELRLASDAEYVDAFREQFAEAVRDRLRSAYPVGVLLSGGLDSASVTAQALALLPEAGPAGQPLHTISATFAHLPECDEQPHIAAVVAAGGAAVQAHAIPAAGLNPLADLDEILAQQDEPFYSPNLYLDRALRRAAQAAGVRVLLDGVDGDSTVSHGFGAVAEAVGQGQWLSAWGRAQIAARHLGAQPRRVLWVMGLRPFVPAAVLHGWRRLRGGVAADPLRLLNPAFAQRVGWAAHQAALQRAADPPPRTERLEHWQRLSQGYHAFALEVENRTSAYLGLEPRSPFFDRRLMEFCLSLPANQKIGAGFTRLIMRRAMEGLLPPSVQWRTDKPRLSANFLRGLRRWEGNRLVRLAAAPEVLAPYVQVDKLRAAVERFGLTSSEADALALWKVVTLAEWLTQVYPAA